MFVELCFVSGISDFFEASPRRKKNELARSLITRATTQSPDSQLSELCSFEARIYLINESNSGEKSTMNGRW